MTRLSRFAPLFLLTLGLLAGRALWAQGSPELGSATPAASASDGGTLSPPMDGGAPGDTPAEAPEAQAGAAKPAGEQLGFLEFFDPEGIPLALIVFVLAWLALKGSERLAERLAERVVERLMIKQAHTLVVFAVYLVATVVAASALLELPAQAIFALSGTIAVTLGFAFKDFAASFLAGISILTNKPFQVGDRITFGGYYGEVQEIGLRTVRLVTLDDNLVTIPSNKFLTDPVASANAGELDCMVVMTFWSTPAADHGRAKQIIHDAVMASKYLYLGKPFDVIVSTRISSGTGRVAVEYTAKAYVYDARHEKAFAGDVTERVLTAFREEGIEVPG